MNKENYILIDSWENIVGIDFFNIELFYKT